MVDGEPTDVNARQIGGTQALLIVHSSIYPNPALEAIRGCKFLGNTYAEFLGTGTATATQVANVMRAEYEDGTDEDGEPIRGNPKVGNVPPGATVRRTNLIPHAWSARESRREQAEVDGLG